MSRAVVGGQEASPLANGLMPAHSRDIRLGYTMSFWPSLAKYSHSWGSSFPEMISPHLPISYLFGARNVPGPIPWHGEKLPCTLVSWTFSWILFHPNAPGACLAWSLNHQPYSSEFLPTSPYPRPGVGMSGPRAI